MNVQECARLLAARDRFLIVTHRRPDGDTIGSAVALCCALRGMGKEAFVYPNPQVTDSYMPFIAPYFAHEDYEASCVVAVDVADSNMYANGFSGKVDLAIDHHPANTGYAQHTLVMSEKSACGEIVLLVLKEMGCPITPEIATVLYMSVSTDTGCFAYSNTTAETHAAAAELIAAGADFQHINKALFRTASAARLQLEAMIFTNLRRYQNGEVNIAIVTLDMMKKAGTTEDDCDDLAALPGKIAGNKISATVRELTENHCKISVRTGTEFDASAICRKFGGGGHVMAAGCEISAPPEKAAEMIAEAIREVWK